MVGFGWKMSGFDNSVYKNKKLNPRVELFKMVG
jgi:hypothetical protein